MWLCERDLADLLFKAPLRELAMPSADSEQLLRAWKPSRTYKIEYSGVPICCLPYSSGDAISSGVLPEHICIHARRVCTRSFVGRSTHRGQDILPCFCGRLQWANCSWVLGVLDVEQFDTVFLYIHSSHPATVRAQSWAPGRSAGCLGQGSCPSDSSSADGCQARLSWGGLSRLVEAFMECCMHGPSEAT